MKHFEGVIEYQIIQEKIDELEVFIVVDEEFDNNNIEKLSKSINEILDNKIFIKMEICDKIIRGSTGKIRSVISKLDTKLLEIIY